MKCVSCSESFPVRPFSLGQVDGLALFLPFVRQKEINKKKKREEKRKGREENTEGNRNGDGHLRFVATVVWRVVCVCRAADNFAWDHHLLSSYAGLECSSNHGCFLEKLFRRTVKAATAIRKASESVECDAHAHESIGRSELSSRERFLFFFSVKSCGIHMEGNPSS